MENSPSDNDKLIDVPTFIGSNASAVDQFGIQSAFYELNCIKLNENWNITDDCSWPGISNQNRCQLKIIILKWWIISKQSRKSNEDITSFKSAYVRSRIVDRKIGK